MAKSPDPLPESIREARAASNRPYMTRYNPQDIPVEFIESLAAELSRRNDIVAYEASDLYSIIARDWARSINAPWPNLSRLECTYESLGWSVYSIPHCNPIDGILFKYFNTIRSGSFEYWYSKRHSSKSVMRWLHDDFRGTMENPY